MYTATELQTAILRLLQASPLARTIRGKILRAGLRPRDSVKEDLTLSIPALDAGQRQAGFVRLTVYVPDLYDDATAVALPDLGRCGQLERALADWGESLSTDRTGDLLLQLAEAPSTLHSPDRPESLVTLRLSVRIAQ